MTSRRDSHAATESATRRLHARLGTLPESDEGLSGARRKQDRRPFGHLKCSTTRNMMLIIADLAHTKAWRDIRDVLEVGIAFGFGGLLVASLVEAGRAFRQNRPAMWGEPTLYGTLLGGLFGVAVELFSKLGVR